MPGRFRHLGWKGIGWRSGVDDGHCAPHRLTRAGRVCWFAEGEASNGGWRAREPQCSRLYAAEAQAVSCRVKIVMLAAVAT